MKRTEKLGRRAFCITPEGTGKGRKKTPHWRTRYPKTVTVIAPRLVTMVEDRGAEKGPDDGDWGTGERFLEVTESRDTR